MSSARRALETAEQNISKRPYQSHSNREIMREAKVYHYHPKDDDYYSEGSDTEDLPPIQRSGSLSVTARRRVILFRGITLLRSDFSSEKKHALKSENRPAIDLMSGAAHFVLMNEEKIEDPIQEIQKDFDKLSEHDQLATLDLYIKDLDDYKEKQLEKYAANDVRTPHSELMSFTLSAGSACRYGMGILASSSTSLLNKQYVHYDAHSKPHHRCLGFVIATAITCKDWDESKIFHVRKLWSQQKVSPDFFKAHGDEVIIVGGIKKDAILFQIPLIMPDFSKNWKESYQDKYGLSKDKFNFFVNEFKSCQDNLTERQELEKRLLDFMLRHYEKQIENTIEIFIPSNSRRYPSLTSEKFSKHAVSYETASEIRKSSGSDIDMDVDIPDSTIVLKKLSDLTDEIKTLFNQEAHAEVISEINELMNPDFMQKMMELSQNFELKEGKEISTCFKLLRIILNFGANSMAYLIGSNKENLNSPRVDQTTMFNHLALMIADYVRTKENAVQWLEKFNSENYGMKFIEVLNRCHLAIHDERKDDKESINKIIYDVLSVSIHNYFLDLIQSDDISKYTQETLEKLCETFYLIVPLLKKQNPDNKDTLIELKKWTEDMTDDLVEFLDKMSLQDNLKITPSQELPLRNLIIQIYADLLQECNASPALFNINRQNTLKLCILGQEAELIRVESALGHSDSANNHYETVKSLYIQLKNSIDDKETLEDYMKTANIFALEIKGLTIS
ncbi:MAG: hypothetical protein SFW66_00915 [Gammaproteobacteria bacterium]|nr:hypothetical protein [Gammaproteobacteria bacterium]